MTDHNQQLPEMLKNLGNPQGGVVSMDHAREAILFERGDATEVSLPDGSTLQLLQYPVYQMRCEAEGKTCEATIVMQ